MPVTVQFGAASYTATEGGAAVTVAVTHRVGGSRAHVTVPLTVAAGGTAIADDYTLRRAAQMSVTTTTIVSAGEMSATGVVHGDHGDRSVEDMVDDDDESITIGFGRAAHDGVTATSPETTTVSLVDNDDPAVTVQFGAASYTATEGGTAATVAVTLSADPERTVTVPLSVTAGWHGDGRRLHGVPYVGDVQCSGQMSATVHGDRGRGHEDDDGESITIGFGTLPAGVTAGSTARPPR